jgi:hypothetical protein
VSARGRAEPAEVEHPLDAGLVRRLAEVDGGFAVAAGEVAFRAHRVDEVVRGAAAVERLVQPAGGHRVAAADVDLRGQGGAARVARERPYGAATAKQLVDEVAADVAGGARDEGGIGVSLRKRHAPGTYPGRAGIRSRKRDRP